MNDELTVADLSPREGLVLIASCELTERSGEREPVIFDPAYAAECERLVEIGWLDRVEVEISETVTDLAGYRLSPRAATAHDAASLIEQSGRSTN
jgi:hypothetical protein